MDPSFFGTWETDLSKTVISAGLGKVLGIDDEKMEHYKKLSYVYKIAPEGERYNISLDFQGGLPRHQFVIKLGEQHEYKTLEGDVAKLTINVNGKTVIEEHTVPSKNTSWVITRSIEGNIMKTVMEAGGETGTSFFNKI